MGEIPSQGRTREIAIFVIVLEYSLQLVMLLSFTNSLIQSYYTSLRSLSRVGNT